MVTKTFLGPGSETRRATEQSVLKSLAGKVPVPEVIDGDGDHLQTIFVPGEHGKNLVSSGQSEAVLIGCGAILRQIQSIDPTGVFDTSSQSQVVVHGDFGPNNLIFDRASDDVVAVVDWEWAHAGEPVEDLAWCEWIIRTHHPEAIASLPSLFEAYGERPTWSIRHESMVAKCSSLLEFADRRDPGSETAMVRRRQLAETLAWDSPGC